MIPILYEDNHLLAVEKPANMPVQGDSSGDDDLLTLLKGYIKDKYNKPGDVYLGLVHRLDRPTGGVMVFAKTSKAAARLSEQMKSGDFEKKYFAVLVGIFQKKKATLTNYLKKNPVNNMVYVCGKTVEGAKFAELEYEVVEEKAGLTLAEIKLHTGRTHQIRVQMAAQSHPVYGDMRYGGENAVKGNLALYATTLSFTHPVSKERYTFKVEPPKDKNPWKLFNTEKAVDIGV